MHKKQYGDFLYKLENGIDIPQDQLDALSTKIGSAKETFSNPVIPADAFVTVSQDNEEQKPQVAKSSIEESHAKFK